MATVAIVVAVFGLMQLVPYRIHNPAVVPSRLGRTPDYESLYGLLQLPQQSTVEPWYSRSRRCRGC